MDMPFKVVIDSNILVGLLNPSDHWHAHSILFHNALKANNIQLLYFDSVITEVISATVRRLFEKARVDDVELFFNKLENQIPKDKITWVFCIG